jgi:hypothetical protein
MASFDIIESANFGYRFVWRERRYLMTLMTPAIMMTLLCVLLINGFGLEGNYFRQGIVMLPAYFAQGWMLSHMVRFIFFKQTWPFRPTGDLVKDEAVMRDRFQGIMSGTIIYILFRLGQHAYMESMLQIIPKDALRSAEQMNALTSSQALAMLIMMIFVIYAVRFAWIYIPAALNTDLKEYLYKTRGYLTSFFMIGLWLVTWLPVMLFADFILSSLTMGSASLKQIAIYLQQIVFLVVLLITGSSMAHAMSQFMGVDNK